MEDSITPEPRPWKKSILTGDVLCAAWWPSPPFILNNSTSLGLNLFILIWTIPPGLNVTSAIPPFIYSVGPGNQFMLLDPDVFFALFFVAGSFNFSCHPFLCRLMCCNFSCLLLIYVLLPPCRLKMARKPRCPDDKPKKKKKDEKAKSTPDGEKLEGGSSHYKRNIGNFTGDVMAACIAEIKRVEAEAKRHGTVPRSRNKIAEDYGVSPSSVSKRMTGKVLSMAPALGGARRGKVLDAGKFSSDMPLGTCRGRSIIGHKDLIVYFFFPPIL